MRAASTDYLQGFRYHVVASNVDDVDPLAPLETREGQGAVAGFQSVTIPELSVEASEYREGTMVWTQKYPGPPTVSELSLIRGLVKRDTAFFDMVMAAVKGDEYRANVTIYHYHRTEMALASRGGTNDDVFHIKCGECFAIRAKPDGDMDAMSGEISLAEVDLAVEKFTPSGSSTFSVDAI